MAFSAILRKSAYSLVPTASRLARANKNFYSAVFSTSSHLNRKPSLGSFVPGFEFSSATETKNCSSNESLLQAIELEFKRIGHVEEIPSEFTFKLNRDFNKGGRANAKLTKKFKGELVSVYSSYISQSDLDENLKNAFQKYLEIRGIKPSMVEFLYKCIRNKYNQINLTVLKKIKNFIEQVA